MIPICLGSIMIVITYAQSSSDYDLAYLYINFVAS